jgi:hypothetical protein
MPFFADLPPEPDAPQHERYIAPPWARVPHEIVAVPFAIAEPVLHRSEEAAMVLADVHVYPTGITFTVLLVAHPTNRTDEAPMHESFHGGPSGLAGRVRVGLLQPDGRRQTFPMREGPGRDEQPPKAVLIPAGGGGGSNDVASTGFWAWPIPPQGDVKLYFRWLSQGLEEREVILDGDALRAAAATAKAQEIWPGADYPEPTQQDGYILGW